MKHPANFFPALFLALTFLGSTSSGDDLRVFSADQKPNDRRLGPPLTLNGYHPFQPVASKDVWLNQRQQEIRERVMLAAGILPMPEKTPLRSRRFGRLERDGFAVEKVYFESFPGSFVTGNLFCPTGDSLAHGEKLGKRPGVLCPHGHWRDGRFYDVLKQGDAAVNAYIARGEERFFNAARNPILARCVQLARMGCYVLQYDMLGYADSTQFAEHRRGPRPEMSSSRPGQWGFVSPQAILRLQTNFGLQTWNSVRALDFLNTIEDLDPARIMVTGASGGGTQTMMVAAVDDRISAAFPCVMPSTSMQGGCTGENGLYLRIGQGNMDIAAALAPKPLGMTAADDWTIELETKGYPDLVSLYKMLGAPKNYEAHFNIQFKHNYNHVSRTQMYDFANRHLELGLKIPVLESDFKFLGPDEISVWKNEADKPANWKSGPEYERAVNATWARDSDTKVADALDKAEKGDRSGIENVIAKGWKIILRRSYQDVGQVEFTLAGKKKTEHFIVMSGLISHKKEGEEIPSLFYYPTDWNGEVVIWLSRKGKAGLYNGDVTQAIKPVRALIDSGLAVVGLDLFMQGEFLHGGKPEQVQNPDGTFAGKKGVPADSWQRSPVYYYGYNDPIFVRRVHDVLSAVKMVKTNPKWNVKKVSLRGGADSSHWLAAAGAMAAEAVDSVEISNESGFHFGQVDDFWNEDFVPGAVKYGDIEGLIAMIPTEKRLPTAQGQ